MKKFVRELLPKKNPRLKNGAEILDPKPVAVPVAFRTSETMDQRIKRIIEHSMSVQAKNAGLETFEEADDFDIEDDPIDPSTPWETDFDSATVNAIERGVVAAPKALEPSRLQELKEKFSKKPKPAPEPVNDPPKASE